MNDTPQVSTDAQARKVCEVANWRLRHCKCFPRWMIKDMVIGGQTHARSSSFIDAVNTALCYQWYYSVTPAQQARIREIIERSKP